MKVLKVIVDEMPKECNQECPFECDWQCRAHDWEQLYAEDFGKIPSWCPLEVEQQFSRSQERRFRAQGWFKYPPAEEVKHE